MATEWQIQQNRRNAALSTGPRTEKGKAASSANSLQHGFYATKLDARYGEPDFEADRKNWIDAFLPENESTFELAEIAFLNLRRLKRLQLVEEASSRLNMVAACDRFDLERHAVVEAAVAKLLEQPFQSRHILTCSIQGCDRLLEILEELRERLELGIWKDEARVKLLAVRGKSAEARDPELSEASRFIVEHQTPVTLDGRGTPLLDLRIGLEPKSEAGATTKGLSPQDAARLEAAWTILLARIEEERETVAGTRGLLGGQEDSERELAMIRNQLDFGPDGHALQRCLTQATRAFQKSFDQLNDAAKVDLSRVETPFAGNTASTGNAEAPEPPRSPIRTPTPSPAPAPRPTPPPPPAVLPSLARTETKAPALRNEPKSSLAGLADEMGLTSRVGHSVGQVPETPSRLGPELLVDGLSVRPA